VADLRQREGLLAAVAELAAGSSAWLKNSSAFCDWPREKWDRPML
jgi:hypothetical protein